MSQERLHPLGLSFQDGKLHVLGYPDAKRVVRLTTTPAKRLAGLYLHKDDLEFCERLMQLLGRTSAGDLLEALWTAILVKFFSCFGHSKARFTLDSKVIYARFPNALTAFDYFKDIRDKHVVHDENNYTLPLVGAVLDGHSEVQDIVTFEITAQYGERENCQNLYNLISEALNFVEMQIVTVRAKVHEEISAMTPAERGRLTELDFRSPGRGDEAKTRES